MKKCQSYICDVDECLRQQLGTLLHLSAAVAREIAVTHFLFVQQGGEQEDSAGSKVSTHPDTAGCTKDRLHTGETPSPLIQASEYQPNCVL